MNKLYIICLLIIVNSCKLGEENVTIIPLEFNNCKIFLKKVTWGTDNCRTYISDNNNLKDTLNEPYFIAASFYFKFDSLNCELIVTNSDTLKRFSKNKVNINVLEVSNIDFRNYNENGFNYIGDYSK